MQKNIRLHAGRLRVIWIGLGLLAMYVVRWLRRFIQIVRDFSTFTTIIGLFKRMVMCLSSGGDVWRSAKNIGLNVVAGTTSEKSMIEMRLILRK